MITIRPGSQTSNAKPCMISSGANDNYTRPGCITSGGESHKTKAQNSNPVFVFWYWQFLGDLKPHAH